MLANKTSRKRLVVIPYWAVGLKMTLGASVSGRYQAIHFTEGEGP
jgi:hypothetical protein